MKTEVACHLNIGEIYDNTAVNIGLSEEKPIFTAVNQVYSPCFIIRGNCKTAEKMEKLVYIPSKTTEKLLFYPVKQQKNCCFT